MTKSIEEKLFAKTARVLGEVVTYANLRAPTLAPDSREYDDDWDTHLRMIKNINWLKEAQLLLSEPEDPNPEYDRGICELLAVQLGLPLSETKLKDCGAFKIGSLLDCCTMASWSNPNSHFHNPQDITVKLIHGSAFCGNADWNHDETTDDRDKLTCYVCKANYNR